MEQDKEQEKGGEGGQCDEHEPLYSYGDSGIQERRGHIPLWLWGVAVVLVFWGVYYLIANWSPPA